MKKIMSFILTAVLIAGLLAGCAGAPAEDKGSGMPDDITEVQDTEAPDAVSAETAAWPRTYVDSLGKEVVLEKKPERIVMAMGFYAENLFALNEFPVAVAGIEGFLGNFITWQPYLSDAAHPVEELGGIQTPNIEKIIQLNPDLIIAAEVHEKIYDDLDKIAPVISISQNDVPTWKDKIREFAKILGMEKEAEEYIARFEEDVKAYREQLEKKIPGESVLIVQVGDKNTFYLRTPKYFSQFYGSESGLGLTAPEGYSDETGGTVTLEGLTELNPDHIFYMSDIAGNYKEVYDQLSLNSVWNSITAVKNGNVHFLDQGAVSGGALAVRYGIDTAFEALNK